LRFVASPGLYLGATAFALSFAGWRARQRYLAIGTAVFGVLCYVASLEVVARTLAPHIRHWPLADFYLKEPSRFAFGLPIAVAVLAALGVDAWRDARSWRERLVLVAPAVGVWGCLPLAFNADLRDLRLFAVGVAVAAIALVASARRPVLLALIPAALAGELVASGLAGQASATTHRERPRNEVMLEPVYPLSRPDVEVGDYLQPGPIARALGARNGTGQAPPYGGGGRYISIDPEDWDVRGMHIRQQPAWWGFMATQRSMLFGLEEAQGYNATEERRYWTFMRAVDPRRIKYNASFLMHPVPLALDLLDVGFIVTKTDRPPDVLGATPVATEGQWTLSSITVPQRAELFPSWTPVQDGTEALDALVHGTVDPKTTAVIELGGFDLQPQRGPPGGFAAFRWVSPQEARIEVDSPGLAALVIRKTYDPNWHAELDGRSVSLLHADYLLQSLFVSKGRHTVVLRYDDPTIGVGLVGSLCSLVLLLGGALALHRRRRTPHGPAVGESPPDADGDRSLVEAP
jgi:hypothetical protein